MSSSTTRKPIIISGATGKQGKAVLTSLLASSPTAESDFHFLALTRDANSASAKALAARSPAISILQGNQDDAEGIFATALKLTNGNPIWGVYSVQVPLGGGQTPITEEKQGKAMVDAAIKHGVRRFVYSSVDRGGDVVSDTNPTPVPHFRSKHAVELHLKQQIKEQENDKTITPMTYTILRPVAFMDGFSPDFMGRMLATWLKTSLSPTTPLAFVAVTDIGVFGANAFLADPTTSSSSEYINKSISLAGDSLTASQIDTVFRSYTTLQAAPTTYEFVAWIVKWMLGDLAAMLAWFESDGYGYDSARLRRLNPGMMDFGTWMEREGKFEKK